MNSKNKEFYTAHELAEKLSLNVMTVYRWVWAKKLKAYKFGKEYRIDRKEFMRFLEKSRVK